MYNLSNILKTANIIFKKFYYRHLATVDKRFVTLQRIRIVRVTSTLSQKKNKSTYRSNKKQDAKVI